MLLSQFLVIPSIKNSLASKGKQRRRQRRKLARTCTDTIMSLTIASASFSAQSYNFNDIKNWHRYQWYLCFSVLSAEFSAIPPWSSSDVPYGKGTSVFLSAFVSFTLGQYGRLDRLRQRFGIKLSSQPKPKTCFWCKNILENPVKHNNEFIKSSHGCKLVKKFKFAIF